MSIEELIERCIRKDGSAWDEFIRQYQGLVRKVAYYRFNNVLRNDVEKNEKNEKRKISLHLSLIMIYSRLPMEDI